MKLVTGANHKDYRLLKIFVKIAAVKPRDTEGGKLIIISNFHISIHILGKRNSLAGNSA
jgi:hypothetical protein